MTQMDVFNYIEEMLNIFVFRINARAKINLLDLNIYAETFFAELLNILYGWNLENINQTKQNMNGIDLIDYKNKIIIQVSSIGNKRKLEKTLSSKSVCKFKNYKFKFLYIGQEAKYIRGKEYYNPYDIVFDSNQDIIDLKTILSCIFNLNLNQQKQICELISQKLKPFMEDDDEKNLKDVELEQILDTVDINSYEKSQSELVKRLKEKQNKNFLDNMINLINENECIIEKIYNYSNKNQGKENGIHFNIIDTPEVKTRFFMIYYYVNFHTLSKEYYIEPVDYVERSLDKGRKLLSFYIEDPNQDGNILMMLAVDNEKKQYIIDMGILLGDEVELGLSPKSLSFNAGMLQINDISKYYYDMDIVENKHNEIVYNTSINSKVLIYDITEDKVVLREKYYDDKKEMWSTKIKLNIYHRYMAISVYPKNKKLTNEEIGNLYLEGDLGFPKDIIKAIEYFEKDNSAEGYYQIGKILTENMNLIDKEENIEYLEKAVKLGSEKAIQYLENLRKNI